MNRASPVDTRRALETANVYAKAGIPFVCMPVLNDEQLVAGIHEANRRLDQAATEAEERAK